MISLFVFLGLDVRGIFMFRRSLMNLYRLNHNRSYHNKKKQFEKMKSFSGYIYRHFFFS